MQIRQLNLYNFRNYDQLNINFSNKYNLIYGKNGSGKTNLIESIYVLALTKSFRTTNDKVLIKDNNKISNINAVINDITDNNYQIIINDTGKTAKINGNKVNKLSEYISKISVVLFNPNDLKIIKDAPSVRRKTLNLELSQLNPSYLKLLNDYNKILKQRNNYLKYMNINSNNSSDYINIITDKLVNLGIEIYNLRKKFIDDINIEISKVYKDITNEDNLSIKYISNYNNLDKQKILDYYKKNINRDIIMGKTLYGIHHDDFDFIKDKKTLKNYGSEGQQKNAIISFKICEINIFKKIKKSYPILILDDLFSELDIEKINNILNLLNSDIQTFITTTEIDKLDKKIINMSKCFNVENGEVREML